MPVTPSTAICSGLPVHRGRAQSSRHAHHLTVRRKERVQTNQTNNGEKDAIDVNLDPDGLDLLQLVASIRHFKCAVHPQLYLVYLGWKAPITPLKPAPAKWLCS